jgi:hypothetical protein
VRCAAPRFPRDMTRAQWHHTCGTCVLAMASACLLHAIRTSVLNCLTDLSILQRLRAAACPQPCTSARSKRSSQQTHRASLAMHPCTPLSCVCMLVSHHVASLRVISLAFRIPQLLATTKREARSRRRCGACRHMHSSIERRARVVCEARSAPANRCVGEA